MCCFNKQTDKLMRNAFGWLLTVKWELNVSSVNGDEVF